MSRQHIPLKDITIGTKGWTAKVIVEAKGMPRSSQHSPILLITFQPKSFLLIPKILTMRDQFIENERAVIVKNIKSKPIIAAYRIRIVSFNGGSMSTKGSSTFVINPNIPEATRLKSWCVDNKAELEQLTLKKSYVGSSSSAIRAPAPHEIIEVKDIQCLEEKQTTFWLQAKISIPHLNQKYWYMACNKCYRRTNIDYKQTFDCVHCAEKQARAMPRCLLEVQLSDKTGALIATLFGENAEKFICCLAETLMQNSTKVFHI
ncbi:hypothetical protein UlMin_026645 [Ulmus minor]